MELFFAHIKLVTHRAVRFGHGLPRLTFFFSELSIFTHGNVLIFDRRAVGHLFLFPLFLLLHASGLSGTVGSTLIS